MKYLVHRKTKEHKVLHRHTEYATCDWHIVQADSDGWIAWDCEADLECPISEHQPYHARLRSGSIVDGVVRWDCYNNHGDVLAYRPILTEKVQEPEPKTIGDLIRRDHPYKDRKQAEKVQEPDYDPRLVSFNLLDRLKAAHEAAQTIPDLEAELREVLGGMGYDLVARSPFVEPEPAVETPQDNKYAAEW